MFMPLDCPWTNEGRVLAALRSDAASGDILVHGRTHKVSRNAKNECSYVCGNVVLDILKLHCSSLPNAAFPHTNCISLERVCRILLIIGALSLPPQCRRSAHQSESSEQSPFFISILPSSRVFIVRVQVIDCFLARYLPEFVIALCMFMNT